MPSLYRSAAALAFAGAAFANPIQQSGDACLAAVTGSAALGDANLRKEHCTSFAKTIVTPSAVTVTTTITGAPSASVTEWSNYKRDVTVCPNEVPNYASACNEAGYKSACSAFGVSGSDTTITIPATTSTKTVYIAKGSNGGNNNNNGVCTSTSTVFATQTAGNGGNNGNGGDNNGKGGNGGVSTVTSTVTKTVAQATVTVTQTAGNGNNGQSNNKGNDDNDSDSDSNNSNGQNCLTDAKAKEFTDAFADLLEHTSYNGTQGAPGSGYHYNVSAKYLAEDFQDYSDSINFMAGIPLGSVTFGSRAAFDYGQGVMQPELSVETMMVSHSCSEITWRWQATTQTHANVMGINHMILSDDLSQIKVNYAEFDNANWLYSFGLDCKVSSNSSAAR